MMTPNQVTASDRIATSKRAKAPYFSWAKRILAGAVLAAAAATLSPTVGQAQSGLQAGSLVCKGDGGWGAIITSKKNFNCTFASADGKVRGTYTGVIRKFGLDIGVTGDTTLTWLVFGPAAMVGDSYVEGSLAGDYAGVGAEASLGIGLGANALVGGSKDLFALQPISVQVQTGVSIAAGVQTLQLVYVGPLQ